MTMYLFSFFFMSAIPNNQVKEYPTTTTAKNTDLVMNHTLTKRVLSIAKNHLWNMMILKLLVQGLHLIITFRQLADIQNFCNQISNVQIEIYIMHLIFTFLFIAFFVVNFIEHKPHNYSVIETERNQHFLEASSSPMIAVDNKRNSVIDLLLITKIISIVMIEKHNKLLPET